ncbi:MAG: GNAT family N-acetyltransferase [Oscillospiraceae bacterium]|nr:GNAT family N-acetyltransferase [Oscillospiraceae bacterium]
MERIPFPFLKKAAENGGAEFYAIYDGETFVGIIYFVMLGDAALIFYFAVEENLRGGGYGSKILSVMKEKYPGTRIFLETEKPDEKAKNNPIRLRRKAFYQRNGFEECGFRTGFLVPYDVLSCGGKVTADEYRKIMRFFAKSVVSKQNPGQERFL